LDGRLDGFQVGLYAVKKRIISDPAGNRTPTDQPVACPYTDRSQLIIIMTIIKIMVL
jgi:hypothetical protein